MAVVRTRQEAEAPLAGERVWVLEDGIATEVRALKPQDVARMSRVPLPSATRVAAALAAAGCWEGPLALTIDALESGWVGPTAGAEDGDVAATLRRFGEIGRAAW